MIFGFNINNLTQIVYNK